MLGFIRNVAAIAASPEPPSRRRLAASYAELRLRRAVGRPPRLARLLDWRVEFVDYPALVDLYLEIFVRRHYPFTRRRERPFVIDAGANIGVASLYFATVAPDANVLAFEPNPTAYRLLAANMRRNGLEHVECLPLALAREPGPRTLRTPAPAHGGASLELEGAGWSSVEVDAVRLSDRIAGRPAVDFLKLDVEGSEQAILDDLYASGTIRLVGELVLEHHPRRAGDLGRLLAGLSDHGFEYRIALAGDAFWQPAPQLVIVHATRLD